MKKILLATALLSTVALGGCAGLTTGGITARVAAIEAEVQADANLVCGFVPTIATIAAFIPGSSSVTPAAASIAESICAAIQAAPPVQVKNAMIKSAKLRAAGKRTAVNVATVNVPNVGLVPISGMFTR